MSFNPQDLAGPVKANLETALRAATIASDGAARLYELNTRTARAALDEVTGQIRALVDAKDPAELRNLATKAAKPDLDKGQAYVKTVYEQLVATQGELAALVESQVTELNKQIVVALDGVLKSAPAGSESLVSGVKSAMTMANQAYETAFQSWRDLGRTVEANVATATSAANGKRKAA